MGNWNIQLELLFFLSFFLLKSALFIGIHPFYESSSPPPFFFAPRYGTQHDFYSLHPPHSYPFRHLVICMPTSVVYSLLSSHPLSNFVNTRTPLRSTLRVHAHITLVSHSYFFFSIPFFFDAAASGLSRYPDTYPPIHPHMSPIHLLTLPTYEPLVSPLPDHHNAVQPEGHIQNTI